MGKVAHQLMLLSGILSPIFLSIHQLSTIVVFLKLKTNWLNNFSFSQNCIREYLNQDTPYWILGGYWIPDTGFFRNIETSWG